MLGLNRIRLGAVALAFVAVVLSGCSWQSKTPLIPADKQSNLPFDPGQYVAKAKNPDDEDTKIPFYYDTKKQYRTDRGQSPGYINVADMGDRFYIAQFYGGTAEGVSYALIEVKSRTQIIVHTPACEGFMEGLARFAGAGESCLFTDYKSLKVAMKDLKRVARNPKKHLDPKYTSLAYKAGS